MRLALFTLISALAALAHPQQNTRLPPSDPILNTAAYGGSACPEGTVSTLLRRTSSLANYTLHVIFDGQYATPLPSPGASRYSANCALILNITVPDGWQYYVNAGGTEYRGYIWLPDASTRLALYATYYYPLVDSVVSIILVYCTRVAHFYLVRLTRPGLTLISHFRPSLRS